MPKYKLGSIVWILHEHKAVAMYAVEVSGEFNSRESTSAFRYVVTPTLGQRNSLHSRLEVNCYASREDLIKSL